MPDNRLTIRAHDDPGRGMYGWLSLEETAPHAGRHALAEARCGLCAHFGQRFSTRSRLLASTDPSLLLVLVDALSAEPLPRTRVRCPLTLMLARRTALTPDLETVGAVAALQLVLAGEKLLDDQLDREGLLARLAARLIEADVAAAVRTLEARAFPVAALREALRGQGAVEADAGADLDALAAPTGAGLGRIAGWLGGELGLDAAGTARCEAFGNTLGRVIYVMDALHDLLRDLARGRFNPLRATLGHGSPRRARFLEAWVEALLARHAEAFAALPLVRHTEVLAGALVAGPIRRAREGLASLSQSRSATPCLTALP
jgi:hypothetical protein